jgi:hypothetical protein
VKKPAARKRATAPAKRGSQKASVKAKTKAKAMTKAKAKANAKVAPRTAPRAAMRRADLGAPVDGYFGRQPPAMRAILNELRAAVERAGPDAAGALKWGIPFYTIDGHMFCAMASHSAHVNLILPGPPGTYPDPDGILEGGGKTGKHLKVRPGETIPAARMKGWLDIAATRAREKTSPRMG